MALVAILCVRSVVYLFRVKLQRSKFVSCKYLYINKFSPLFLRRDKKKTSCYRDWSFTLSLSWFIQARFAITAQFFFSLFLLVFRLTICKQFMNLQMRIIYGSLLTLDECLGLICTFCNLIKNICGSIYYAWLMVSIKVKVNLIETIF